jgi:hypothetical protein
MCYTDPVKKRNLTLTLDDDLLRAARKAALDRNTSVNQMVREYLIQVTQEADQQKAAFANIDDIFRSCRVNVGSRNWTRDELHDR